MSRRRRCGCEARCSRKISAAAGFWLHGAERDVPCRCRSWTDIDDRCRIARQSRFRPEMHSLSGDRLEGCADGAGRPHGCATRELYGFPFLPRSPSIAGIPAAGSQFVDGLSLIDMESPRSQFVLKLLPSFADFAFLMPIVFLFARMDGVKTLLSDCDTGWHIRTGEWILANRRGPQLRYLFVFQARSAVVCVGMAVRCLVRLAQWNRRAERDGVVRRFSWWRRPSYCFTT